MAHMKDVPILTDKLRQILLDEGLSENANQESEQIMSNEYAALKSQLIILKQKHWLLMDTLRHLEREKVDLVNKVFGKIFVKGIHVVCSGVVIPRFGLEFWNKNEKKDPTNHNLLAYHVPVNGSCPFCHHACDSTTHALFNCSGIKHCWKGTGFWHILKQARHLEASDISLCLKDKLTKEEFEGFVMRSWAIWSERLRLTHLRNEYPHAINVEWCTSLLKDFQEARQALWLVPHHESLSSPNSWIAPPVNTLCLDVDASYNEGCNSFALDGIIRSHEGQPVLAFGKKIEKPISVTFAKLLAIQIGVNISREHNIVIHLITSDSLLVVQAVTSGDENRSYVGTLASDIRATNNVAHSIASFACSSPSYFVWQRGDFPFWLINLVIKDLDLIQ